MGFYYDDLINNKDLTFRLFGFKDQKKYNGGTSYSQSGGMDNGMELILSDFIRDPLSVSIAHSYTGQDSGIVNAFTNLKTWIFTTMQDSNQEYLNKYANLLNEFGLNGTLTMQDTVAWQDYYRVYTGTTVSIPIQFQVTLLTRKVNDKWKTPLEQLQDIQKFFLCTDVNTDNHTYGVTYSAPHNYRPTQAITNRTNGIRDNLVDGTLVLLYGRYAVLQNLILTNYDFTLSKEQILVNEKGSPLYITLNITLAPALCWSSDDILDILRSEVVGVEDSGLQVGGYSKVSGTVRKKYSYDN